MGSAAVVTTTFLSFQSIIEEHGVWLVRAGTRFLDSALEMTMRIYPRVIPSSEVGQL